MLRKGINSFKQRIIGKAAEQMIVEVRTPPANIASINQLTQSRVALVTTAGVHLNSEVSFDVAAGDSSYRVIPDLSSPSELMISHTHYDRTDADQDVNCVFPIERLREFVREGIIQSAASNHFGFMGYIPKTEELINKTAPEVAKKLKLDNVDIVLLSPG